jgi:hypothetical protein
MVTIESMRRWIEASTDVRASFERARAILTDDPGSVVSDHATPGERAARRFHAMLGVKVADGGGLHQEVIIDVGSARAGGGDVTVPVQWCATARGRLFPSFAGELRVCARPPGSNLTVRGSYSVPLGPLGRISDKLGGSRLARRSLSDFVEQAAGRLDSAVGPQADRMLGWTTTYEVDVREVGSENYIG